MADCAALLADIDTRVAHIIAQVSLGTSQEEVVAEQYRALLVDFSMLRGVELETIAQPLGKHRSVF